MKLFIIIHDRVDDVSVIGHLLRHRERILVDINRAALELPARGRRASIIVTDRRRLGEGIDWRQWIVGGTNLVRHL